MFPGYDPWSHVTADEAPPAPGFPRGERIRAARELRMLTQRELVGELRQPITPAALSQIESAKTRPSPETLEDLAAALQVPVGYFANPWPTGSGPNVTGRVTYFRDLASTPSKQRRRAAALAGLLDEVLAAVQQRVQLPPVRVPRFSLPPDADQDDVEATAEAIRGEWDLGDDPVAHVISTVEAHGVPVARLRLGARTVDAFSVRFPARPVILLTADKSNYVRSRFDAAHELAHLIAHAEADASDRRIEAQAHRLAGAVLLPLGPAHDHLPRRLDNSGWRRLADLKAEWGMSLGALLMRARAIGTISPEAHQSAMKFMSMRGWRTEEPGDRQMGPPEAAKLFERAFSAIKASSGESLEDVLVASDLPVQDCTELILTSGDTRPTIAL